MDFIKKNERIIFIISLAVFIWGIYMLLMANFYQPVGPQSRQGQPLKFANHVRDFSIQRYQPLMEGTLFFEKPSPKPVPVFVPPPFQSKLIVWGITTGSVNRAVVSTDPQVNQQTWIVKVGDSVAGEKVLQIGKDFIKVKNGSGVGKVVLQNE